MRDFHRARAALRVVVAIQIVLVFSAVGAFIGGVLSLPSGTFGAIAGGGHGGVAGAGVHDNGPLIGGLVGFALALVAAWGLARGSGVTRWIGTLGASIPASFVAVLIPVWGYPLWIMFVLLLVPLACAALLVVERAQGRASVAVPSPNPH